LHSYTHITGNIRDAGMHVFEHKMRHFVLKFLNMATQMIPQESRVRLWHIGVRCSHPAKGDSVTSAVELRQTFRGRQSSAVPTFTAFQRQL